MPSSSVLKLLALVTLVFAVISAQSVPPATDPTDPKLGWPAITGTVLEADHFKVYGELRHVLIDQRWHMLVDDLFNVTTKSGEYTSDTRNDKIEGLPTKFFQTRLNGNDYWVEMSDKVLALFPVDDLENPIWFTSREGYTGGADNHSFVLGKYAFINTTLVYDLETATNNPVTLSPLAYTALVEVPESTKDRIVKECFGGSVFCAQYLEGSDGIDTDSEEVVEFFGSCKMYVKCGDAKPNERCHYYLSTMDQTVYSIHQEGIPVQVNPADEVRTGLWPLIKSDDRFLSMCKPSSDKQNSADGLAPWMIAVVVAGPVALLIVVIVVIAYVVYRRRQSSNTDKNFESAHGGTGMTGASQKGITAGRTTGGDGEFNEVVVMKPSAEDNKA